MEAVLQSRSCPVCQCAESEPWLKKPGVAVVRCRQCGQGYVRDAAAELVSGEYYDQAGGSFYRLPDKLAADYAPRRFERELKLFRRHVPRGAVLDVGCSTGGFLYHLQRQFPGEYTIRGTDVSREPLEYAESQGIPTWTGDFLRMPRPPGGYAAITFWAVLEHLAEPALFLEHAADLLADGGRCFVLVPNCGSLAFRLLGARYRYVLPEHLNYFCRAPLLLLAQRRFNVVEATTTHFNPVVILKDVWRGARPVPREERVALLKQTTRWKESRWLIPLQWGYRMVEAILGRFDFADNLCVVLKPKQRI